MLEKIHGPLVDVDVRDRPQEAEHTGRGGDEVGGDNARGGEHATQALHLAGVAAEEEGDGAHADLLDLRRDSLQLTNITNIIITSHHHRRLKSRILTEKKLVEVL